MVDGSTPTTPDGNLYQELLARAQRRRQLISVHWELTHRCNERCSHCYLDVLRPGDSVPGELTTGECLGVIDQLATIGVLNLSFSGGEVLTRPDFFVIAEYAQRTHFVLRVFTNGLKITPEVADRLAGLHPYAVEISLYGVDASTHDGITRVPGSFERTTNAFRLLHERNVRTMMKTPLMHDNVHQFDQMVEFAQKLGARPRIDQTLTPKVNGDLAPLRHRMTEDDQLAFMRRTLDPAHWPHALSEDGPTCGIGQSGLVIDPYGNVFPCVEVRLCAGSVRQQTLEAIWRESSVWKEVLALKRSNLPVCRECTLAGWCLRCHGGALNETKDLRGISPAHCAAARLRKFVLATQYAEGANR